MCQAIIASGDQPGIALREIAGLVKNNYEQPQTEEEELESKKRSAGYVRPQCSYRDGM